MTISLSQYLFLWQAIPALFNAIYIYTSPGEWLHPSTLAYENTLPALHVSRYVSLPPASSLFACLLTVAGQSELSITVGAYYLLAAYRRDHGMMKLAIPLRLMAFLVGILDGGMWIWVSCYELLMATLTAWVVRVEGGC